MQKQAWNPYLPLGVCIPDGEPHVFGDRVYIYGSHDKEGGDQFCMLDYEVFSAPVDDLGAWESHGTVYRARQDPSYGEAYRFMYAPDAVCGADGRYYLYYSMAGGTEFTGPVHVAVCDTPAGAYEYYGEVRNPDGSPFRRNITFDPAVLNDNGVIRLYYGWALALNAGQRPPVFPEPHSEQLIAVEQHLFGKTREEILREPESLMGAFTVQLADDMLTVTTEPKRLVVGQLDSLGTECEGHAFFEASSMRKVGETYYFIYSSEQQHELCYATSRFPDRDFRYRGTLVSNGDIGLAGRSAQDRLAATGNNHGSIEQINGKWYVFYHRQTHGTSFSRQGCAEEITIGADGEIAQVEMTSCGLNGGPLRAEGTYPAGICCNLTNGHMPHIGHLTPEPDIPMVTNDGEERFVANLAEGCRAVYKYFAFAGAVRLEVLYRGSAGTLRVTAGTQSVETALAGAETWQCAAVTLDANGVLPFTLAYCGAGKVDLREFRFVPTPDAD